MLDGNAPRRATSALPAACGLALAALSQLCGAALADEARFVPTAGTEATYRTTITTDARGQKTVLGFVYRLTTTSSDGKTAESGLRPLAYMYECPGANTSKDCSQARNMPGVSRDHDQLVITLPATVSDSLAKLGKHAAQDFLRIDQSLPIPGPVNIDEVDKPQLADEPLLVQRNAIFCGDPTLGGFLPLGRAAHASVSCAALSEISHNRLPPGRDITSTQPITVDLTYNGRQPVTVPAGAFTAAMIRFKSVPSEGGNGPTIEGDFAVDEKTGLVVRYDGVAHLPNNAGMSHIMRELIKLSP